MSNSKLHRLMSDYESVVQAKNRDLAEARECLALREKENRQLRKDLERVSALLADSDRTSHDWEQTAAGLQLRVERFEKEALERELNKAQRLKEEDENFRLRMEIHKEREIEDRDR